MARKWRKKANYGTVVLPNGHVLSQPTDIVEGDQWAIHAEALGLEEVRVEPVTAPLPLSPPPQPAASRLLVDEQVGSKVALVEEKPVVAPPPAEIKKVPVETKPPPVEVKKPPAETKSIPVEIKKVSVETKKPEVEAKKAPAETKKPPVSRGTTSESVDGVRGGAKKKRSGKS